MRGRASAAAGAEIARVGTQVIAESPSERGGVRIFLVLTCVHCGELIESAGGVWFHPYRRFQGHHGDLPVLCDFGDRIGPTRAAPVAVTSRDRDFLHSAHVASDDESFFLEALWLEWQHANTNLGPGCCIACHVSEGGQHVLDCEHGARMVFGGSPSRQKFATRR
jgi:hypothetical protein